MLKKNLEKKYGTWTVLWKEIYHVMPSWRKVSMVLCKCECWTEKYVQRQHLLNWSSKNCWCLKKQRFADITRITNTKHWMEWSQPYRKFMSAKARCENPHNASYYRYGWRWIKMVRKDFKEFRDDMKESYYEHVKRYWKDNTTIDRIDVNWNYCKDNCRWATWDEQCNNMSTNHSVVYKWKTYPSISRLAAAKWVSYWLIRDRIRRWWSVEDAVDLPKCTDTHVKRKTYKIQQASSLAQAPLW